MIDGSEIERVFRAESGRAVASLVRLFGDIDLAEEAVQEAFEAAVRRWPQSGLPPSPAGWIITTARNRAIDRLRREASREERHRQALVLEDPDGGGNHPVEDDRLRLIFTCCHPALALPAQVALTLRLVAGLRTSEIARAFLVSEATMAQRLTRAKHKIRAARIPYRVPTADEMPARLRAVLAVVYLIFTEGHTSTGGDDLSREELCAEAVRLARLLAGLMPEEPEVAGLLALVLLTEARRPARTDAEGNLVRLPDQDRARWDRQLVAEGQALVRACLQRNQPGPYQIQAAIAAVHADASGPDTTDWDQIVRLYDQLLVHLPTPVVARNRAIALAERDGPAAGLAALEPLQLSAYHLFHAARAHLLGLLGQRREALDAYERALQLASNPVERRHLEQQRRSLLAGRSHPG